MAYDLEEQEQIAKIKAWWEQYGTMVFIVIAACLATVLAFQGWRYYRAQQTTAASSRGAAGRTGDYPTTRAGTPAA